MANARVSFAQENRLAFVKPDFDYTTSSVAFGTILTKKKKKSLYTSKRNAEFDPNDISVFEEVVKMPPFKRKTLVLIGAQVLREKRTRPDTRH